MNFKALCFVDMPFGQKPDLKSGPMRASPFASYSGSRT
jgi:hypothetical protein